MNADKWICKENDEREELAPSLFNLLSSITERLFWFPSLKVNRLNLTANVYLFPCHSVNYARRSMQSIEIQ